MRRWTRPVVLVLLTGVAAAGCGGGSDTKDDNPTSTGVQTVTPTPAKPAVAGSIAEAEQRLKSHGYTVAALAVNPPAKAARTVGGHVLMYEYASPAAAQKGAKLIRSAVSQNPKRGLADAEGRRVYFLGEPRDITVQERAAFADLVDVAEGR
ncbi:MAG: hypothetical protein QOJ85_1957 [Solirubrobacteraceae bacterium]|nr:hypothetical protein [Solirubrobacteraceae bacterium]